MRDTIYRNVPATNKPYRNVPASRTPGVPLARFPIVLLAPTLFVVFTATESIVFIVDAVCPARKLLPPYRWMLFRGMKASLSWTTRPPGRTSPYSPSKMCSSTGPASSSCRLLGWVLDCVRGVILVYSQITSTAVFLHLQVNCRVDLHSNVSI